MTSKFKEMCNAWSPKVTENGGKDGARRTTTIEVPVAKGHFTILTTAALSLLFAILIYAGERVWTMSQRSSELNRLSQEVVLYWSGEKESEALKIAKQNTRACEYLLDAVSMLCAQQGVVVPLAGDAFFDE